MTKQSEKWLQIATAPKDGTLVLLVYYTSDGHEDYDVGLWVTNYGCPGWRAAGTFIDPVAWMPIPRLSNERGAVMTRVQKQGTINENTQASFDGTRWNE